MVLALVESFRSAPVLVLDLGRLFGLPGKHVVSVTLIGYMDTTQTGCERLI